MIVINFANPDMVGHTGVEDAAIKAIEQWCLRGKNGRGDKETGVSCLSVPIGNAEQLVDYGRASLDRPYNEPGTVHPCQCRSFL